MYRPDTYPVAYAVTYPDTDTYPFAYPEPDAVSIALPDAVTYPESFPDADTFPIAGAVYWRLGRECPYSNPAHERGGVGHREVNDVVHRHGQRRRSE
jgi:hypothetical protein